MSSAHSHNLGGICMDISRYAEYVCKCFWWCIWVEELSFNSYSGYCCCCWRHAIFNIDLFNYFYPLILIIFTCCTIKCLATMLRMYVISSSTIINQLHVHRDLYECMVWVWLYTHFSTGRTHYSRRTLNYNVVIFLHGSSHH